MGEFSVWTDIEVRFRDTDAMGHVNNAVYITYLEVGRQAYWKRVAPDDAYDRVPFVVAHIDIDFLSPALVADIVRVQLRTTWVGGSSFAMEYELVARDADRMLVRASTVLVTYDYAQQRAMPVPDWLRRRLAEVEGHPLPGRPPRN